MAPPLLLKDVYDAHAPFVFRTLRRFGLSEVDARDVSQEVFLTVHRNLHTFEGRAALTTWLYAICRSTTRDWNQRAHRRYEAGSDALHVEVDPRPDAAAVVEQREKLAILLAMLDQIEWSQREVFALFELEGLSGEDISEMLGIPIPTVHSRLRLARGAFQQACDRYRAGERFASQRSVAARPLMEAVR